MLLIITDLLKQTKNSKLMESGMVVGYGLKLTVKVLKKETDPSKEHSHQMNILTNCSSWLVVINPLQSCLRLSCFVSLFTGLDLLNFLGHCFELSLKQLTVNYKRDTAFKNWSWCYGNWKLLLYPFHYQRKTLGDINFYNSSSHEQIP